MKDYLLIKAKKLRKNGYSFREISEILNISKSTASVWSREEEISKIGIKRLEDIREKAIKKSKQVNHQKKVKFLEKLERETIEISGDYSIKDYKIFLALLYWGEGAKTGHSVRFINSDPLVIKSFLWLFRRSFNCDESKFRTMLHLNGYHNQEQMISFWADITNVPPKQFHI